MITDLRILPAGPGRWTLRWGTTLPGTPTFHVWRDGRRVLATLQRSVDVAVPPGTFPRFDVFDTAAATPPASARLPRHATITWSAAAGASGYDVEQEDPANPGTWRQIARVLDDGAGYFAVESTVLPDDTVCRFRVRAFAGDRLLGPSASLAVLVVRVPDPPAATFAYAAGPRTVTVTLP